MTNQFIRICDECQKETDRFKVCENCNRLVCMDCITNTSGVMKEGSPVCSRCGSSKIKIYYKGKTVP